MRAVLLAAALVGAVLSPAASRAETSKYVTLEIYRARPGGPKNLAVELHAKGTQTGLVAHMHLRKTADGYRDKAFGISQYSGSDAMWRAYSPPLPPTSCPAAPLCTGDEARLTSYVTFDDVQPTDRLLVAGIRGEVSITIPSASRWWRVRTSSVGFRVVTAPESDATGAFVYGLNIEYFRSATAVAGPYGSAAFADIPCSAGTATLAAEGTDDARLIDCDKRKLGFGFAETHAGRRWTVAGNTVGSTGLNRLVVFDYPK